MPMIELLFNPLAGPAGINGVACMVWLAIVALTILSWVESER